MTDKPTEKLRLGDQQFEVSEAGRPAGRHLCRHLITVDRNVHFLEYVISVGPYKFDLPVVYRLTDAEAAAWETGTLSLGELAARLAAADEASGTYERPV